MEVQRPRREISATVGHTAAQRLLGGWDRSPEEISKHTNLPEVMKSSLLKPQQFDDTLNVQFKQTRAADLLLAQPLPPLIAHDSVRNVMSHALKAADADKRPNVGQLKINKQRESYQQSLCI